MEDERSPHRQCDPGIPLVAIPSQGAQARRPHGGRAPRPTKAARGSARCLVPWWQDRRNRTPSCRADAGTTHMFLICSEIGGRRAPRM